MGANVPVTTIWPDYAIEGNFLNHNILGAGGVGTVIPIAGVDYPYQNARCQLRFGNIFQENMLVQDFYDKVRRDTELLSYGNDRGLNNNSAIEAERIGIERDIKKLVTLLKQVEKKAELHLGLRLKPVRPKPKPKPQCYYDNDITENDLTPPEIQNIVRLLKRHKIHELSLDDHDDPIDTFNAIQVSNKGKTSIPSSVSKLVKSAKTNTLVRIPVIKSTKNITKTELINLLKLTDIRKIIQEIVYKILENYESAPQEQPEVQEYLYPMPMDIDVAQLENTKDLWL
ncbi:hypothetical protein RclHR1_10250007 [Rhizophagus clarus]|uniref:Uncharacterized protein n=1 Tax=Rhizophagus clarus TaxID=94130 RepID=A0A2Z6QT78_9GLOM|nr:hypothetical protein RclHR1_10250007 [Rhizophagus clarus]